MTIGKRERIEVATAGGGRSVDANVFGRWAVHLQTGGTDYGRWAVTHIPTGTRIAHAASEAVGNRTAQWLDENATDEAFQLTDRMALLEALGADRREAIREALVAMGGVTPARHE